MFTPAPLPDDESARLAALFEYRLLNTPPEPGFDRLTRLAASLCDAPIAALSLVDRDRQWFKSRVGLDLTETPREGAICAHAILDDAVLVVPDVGADPRFRDSPLVAGAPGVRSYAGAPLVTPTGHRIGALCVIHREVTALSAQQIAGLQELAAAAVELMELRVQVERARFAEESFQAQVSDFEFTKSMLEEQAAQLVGLAEDRDELYRDNIKNRRFIESLLHTIPLPIFARDANQIVTHANPAYAAFHGLTLEDVQGRHISEFYSDEHVRQSIEEDRLLLMEPSGRRTFEKSVRLPGLDRVQDIIVHKAVIRDEYGAPQGVVGAVSDVTEMKTLQVELERLAATDPLTGAANRRAFMDRAESELRRCRRSGRPLSLIMLDLDRFKAINDEFGHHAGDDVLRCVASVCGDTIRQSVDLMARIGGEEFVVIAPDTDLDGAARLAERLRGNIERQHMVFEGRRLRFTASFGVAAVDPNSASDGIECALKRADDCLYRAKAAGRNRVTVDAAPMLEPA